MCIHFIIYIMCILHIL